MMVNFDFGSSFLSFRVNFIVLLLLRSLHQLPRFALPVHLFEPAELSALHPAHMRPLDRLKENEPVSLLLPNVAHEALPPTVPDRSAGGELDEPLWEPWHLTLRIDDSLLFTLRCCPRTSFLWFG